MKNSILWKLSAAFAGLAGCLSLSFSSAAAVPAGRLEGADESSVYGWVWDSDNYNHVIPVEISVYPTGSSQSLTTGIVKADKYQDNLQKTIGDGYHGFLYSVDWNQFEQTEFRVTARTLEDGEESVFLGELTYNKETHTCTIADAQRGGGETRTAADTVSDQPNTENTVSDKPESLAPSDAVLSQPDTQQTASRTSQTRHTATDTSAPREIGPGIPQPEPPKKEPEYISLGMFHTTGYCNCEKCCPSGSSLTYSGTVPQPEHTISADISVFPIGTRLMINGIIYTVEDIGSNVVGNKIDIFYATHEEAEDHGLREVEVFSVPEEQDSNS